MYQYCRKTIFNTFTDCLTQILSSEYNLEL